MGRLTQNWITSKACEKRFYGLGSRIVGRINFFDTAVAIVAAEYSISGEYRVSGKTLTCSKGMIDAIETLQFRS